MHMVKFWMQINNMISLSNDFVGLKNFELLQQLINVSLKHDIFRLFALQIAVHKSTL
jgi:hypothetical protein